MSATMSLVQAANSAWLPHGYCLAWSPLLVWSMVVSDVLIALAYYSIPVALYVFARRHPELRYRFVLMLFAAFIFACGTTHIVDIVSIWRPNYRLDAALKVVTAAISLMTAIALWPLLPRISAYLSSRELEQRRLKESNAELERFAFVASHDLKAPLRTLGGFAQLLQQRYRGKLDADADEFLGFMQTSLSDAHTLIDDLLALAQVNERAFSCGPVALQEVADRVQKLLAVDIEQADAKISVGSLPVVQGDERMLLALLQNLLSNAIKFRRPDAAPVVQVSAEQLHKGLVRVSVQDNGIGIESAHQSKLFQAFTRLHSKDQFPGTGIGLALCQKIAVLHGGRAGLSSTPGRGSRFWVELPLANA